MKVVLSFPKYTEGVYAIAHTQSASYTSKKTLDLKSIRKYKSWMKHGALGRVFNDIKNKPGWEVIQSYTGDRMREGTRKGDSKVENIRDVSRMALRTNLNEGAEAQPITGYSSSRGYSKPHVEVKPSDDPQKLADAQERLRINKVLRGREDAIIKSIIKEVSKKHPVGESFKDKIKHAIHVQKAVDGISLYSATERYFKSLGIDRPSNLGIYEEEDAEDEDVVMDDLLEG